MKCPSSWPLNFDEFPFFKTSVPHLEPELEHVEVWSILIILTFWQILIKLQHVLRATEILKKKENHQNFTGKMMDTSY